MKPTPYKFTYPVLIYLPKPTEAIPSPSHTRVEVTHKRNCDIVSVRGCSEGLVLAKFSAFLIWRSSSSSCTPCRATGSTLSFRVMPHALLCYQVVPITFPGSYMQLTPINAHVRDIMFCYTHNEIVGETLCWGSSNAPTLKQWWVSQHLEIWLSR